MGLRKLLAITAAFPVVLLGPGATSPAGAALAGAGAGAVVASAISTPPPPTPVRTLTATIKADIKIAANTAVVTFQCEAIALPDAASTGITACSVNGRRATTPVPLTLPGPYSTAAGVVTFPYTGGPITLCVGAQASYILGGTLTASRCGPAIVATSKPVEDIIVPDE